MLELYRQAIGSYTLHVVATERVDGDQRPDRDRSLSGCAARARRQRSLTGFEWTMVAEEHGITVLDADIAVDADTTLDADVTVDSDLGVSALSPGDVLVTARTNRALAVWAGDCAPLVLCGRDGTLVVAHAGWRGLAAGVIDVAVAELTSRGDRAAVAVLGPCIHAECYEFGDEDLDAVAAGVGATTAEIAGTTRAGRRALDVPGAITAALGRHGITLDVVGPCTACDERWFSHRARNEDGRHAVVALDHHTHGHIDGSTDGDVNGRIDGDVNGGMERDADGRTDGDVNGSTFGDVNGDAEAETDGPSIESEDEAAATADLRERVAGVRRAVDAVERVWSHEVEILAVTKGFGPAVVERAVAAGCSSIGENYAQDLLGKREAIERLRPRVHFIGHLQSNKVRQIAGLVDVWSSLDRVSVIDEIARRVASATVLIQVNSTGEPDKSGCAPEDAASLVDAARQAGLSVQGLMTVGPTSGDPDATAAAFALTRSLVDELGLVGCSMGMSGDLELAVAHGSTQVRIGTALFGPRPSKP